MKRCVCGICNRYTSEQRAGMKAYTRSVLASGEAIEVSKLGPCTYDGVGFLVEDGEARIVAIIGKGTGVMLTAKGKRHATRNVAGQERMSTCS